MTASWLFVDIGNSRLKWNQASLGASGFEQPATAIDYRNQPLIDLLDQQWGNIKAPYPAVAVVNVAGKAMEQQLTDWCVTHWDVTPRFITTAERFQNVTNGYTDYTQLGADRWLAAIAAHHHKPDHHNVIIDCGSAITVDTVMADGQHRGGPIIPGPAMMLAALSANTADLGQYAQPAELSAAVFVNNSGEGIASGVSFATGQALDGIIGQIQDKLSGAGVDNNKTTLWVTGGAAAKVMPLTGITDYTHEPDLVLQGLQLVTAARQQPE
jgi:type III pantothenate kinase